MLIDFLNHANRFQNLNFGRFIAAILNFSIKEILYNNNDAGIGFLWLDLTNLHVSHIILLQKVFKLLESTFSEVSLGAILDSNQLWYLSETNLGLN